MSLNLDPTLKRNNYFKSYDGTKLFYSKEGSGPALIFCYGIVCSHLHWIHQMEYFKKNYSVYYMDYRGHGNSDSPKDYSKLSIETLTKDLKLMMEECELKEAIFLGHSMGVNIVLEFYKQFPKYVKAMVLANGTPTKPLDTLLLSNSLRPAFKVLENTFQKFPHLSKTLWKYQKNNKLVSSVIGKLGFNTQKTSQKEIQAYVNNISEIDPLVFLNLIKNYDRYDGMSWLQSVEVPTLVLSGDKDLIIPPSKSILLHQLIPNSELEIVPNGSHCTQMDFPDLVNQRIEDFINKYPNLPKETSNQ